MSARGFGRFGIIIEDDMPRVAFVSDAAGEELGVTPDNLPDLRRALDWLESEWAAPDAGQPRLPLEPTCATCRRFMGAYEGYRGKTYGLCQADMFELQAVPADGSGGCEKHEPKGASDGQ